MNARTWCDTDRVPIQFTREEASEVIALDLYEHADGVPVTHAMVAERIAELSTHPPGCRRCNRRCRMAAHARPDRVLRLVQWWQAAARRTPASVHMSRRQARRASALR